MKKIFVVLFLSLTLACGKSESFSVDKHRCLCANTCYCAEDINQTDAKTKISKGAVLIDVRTPAEYNTSHIDGAFNLALEKIESIDLDKEKVIIVYCRSGSRSKEAADALIAMGYKYVYDLGAFENWR